MRYPIKAFTVPDEELNYNFKISVLSSENPE